MRKRADRKKGAKYGLVIDADIARAAGEATDPASESCLCRMMLDVVRGSQLRLVMSEDTTQQWDYHRSGYARKWLSAMVRLERVEAVPVEHDSRLRRYLLLRAGNAEDRRLAARNDVHLLEAALATDNRILSKERIAREFFSTCSEGMRKLGPILWANPCRPEDRTCDWLRCDAPDEPGRRLMAFRETKAEQ